MNATARPCPVCGVSVLAGNLARHLATPHTARCDVCDVLCIKQVHSRSLGITRHREAVHGISPTGRTKNSEHTICPACNVRVIDTEYAQHRRAHAIPIEEWAALQREVYAIIGEVRL